MVDLHIDLHDAPPASAAWGDDDDFDAEAMERALLAARRRAYEELGHLDDAA